MVGNNEKRTIPQVFQEASSRAARELLLSTVRGGEATAAGIVKSVDGALSETTARRLIAALESEGKLKARLTGRRKLYTTAEREAVR